MSGKTSGTRRLGLLAVAAAVAVLTAGCGVVHVHFGSSDGPTPVTYQEGLAYAQCMRTHGLPNFPEPRPHQSYSVNGQVDGTSPLARANEACRHLLT